MKRIKKGLSILTINLSFSSNTNEKKSNIYPQGSSLFWVATRSPSIDFESNSSHPSNYNCVSSQTCEELSSQTFKISYKDNTFVNGTMVRDTIQLESLVLKEQVFGLATNQNVTNMFKVKKDGIIGLSFPRNRNLQTDNNQNKNYNSSHFIVDACIVFFYFHLFSFILFGLIIGFALLLSY